MTDPEITRIVTDTPWLTAVLSNQKLLDVKPGTPEAMLKRIVVMAYCEGREDGRKEKA